MRFYYCSLVVSLVSNTIALNTRFEGAARNLKQSRSSPIIIKYDPTNEGCSGTDKQAEGYSEDATTGAREKVFGSVTDFLSRILLPKVSENSLEASVQEMSKVKQSETFKFIERSVIQFFSTPVKTVSSTTVPTITCEFQKLVMLDICSFDNFDEEAPSPQLLSAVTEHPCVDFAEYSTSLKPIVGQTDATGFDSSNELRGIEAESILDTSNIPNDPSFNQQWALNDSEPFSVKAQAGWRSLPTNAVKSGGDTSDVVAVMDTGSFIHFPDVVHPELSRKLWRNEGDCTFDGIDSDKNGYVDDCYGWNFGERTNDVTDYLGHGTVVAGTIAADTNNSIGVASLGWPVRVMTLVTYYSTAEFVQIVNYIAGHRVKILNGSFAFSRPDPALQQLVKAGRQHGILMVFAASNENCNNDQITSSGGGTQLGCDLYPASFDYDNIISVCATDRLGAKAYFSSYGRRTVDVCAPGHQIYGIANPTINGGQYGLSSGTSIAAPIVSALAALVRSISGSSVPKDIRDIIVATCTPVQGLQTVAACGGIINAHAAVEAIKKMVAQRLNTTDANRPNATDSQLRNSTNTEPRKPRRRSSDYSADANEKTDDANG